MTLEYTINQLSRYRTVLSGMLAAIPADSVCWKPAPDRWSVLEIVNHLADIETEDFRTDLEIILHSPGRPWPSFDIERWVVERQYNIRDYNESVERFLSARNANLEWLAACGDPALDRVHSGTGFTGIPMRAGDVLASWVGHDIYHTRQLAAIHYEILERGAEPFSPAYSGYRTTTVPFNSPLSSEKAAEIMSWMGLEPGNRVLDAGCGRGEFLIRMAERHGIDGAGIDIDEAVIEHAKREAANRVPLRKLNFLARDIAGLGSEEELFDEAVCLGATHSFAMGENAFEKTIAGLKRLVKPGGTVFIGEGYWKRPPEQGYLDLLGEPVGIYRSHSENIALAESLGCQLVYEDTSNVAEWDCFETSHRERIGAGGEKWWKAYIRWGRTAMGFGLYVFRLP